MTIRSKYRRYDAWCEEHPLQYAALGGILVFTILTLAALFFGYTAERALRYSSIMVGLFLVVHAIQTVFFD